MSEFVTVARTAQIPAGVARVFTVQGKSLAVCHTAEDDTFHAIDNVCSHDRGPLGEGTLRDGQIECPRHGALFDIRSGAARTLPAIRPVRAYETRVVQGEVQVKLA